MKRLTIVFVVAAAALPIVGARAATDAHAAPGVKLEIRQTALGRILANGRGMTVYMFTRDPLHRGTCAMIGGCTGIWPPVTTHGTPRLGAGVKRALVGTIMLPSGAHQVAYAGHPLYTYIGDSCPGDTSYVGQRQFGGRWFALSSTGRPVK